MDKPSTGTGEQETKASSVSPRRPTQRNVNRSAGLKDRVDRASFDIIPLGNRWLPPRWIPAGKAHHALDAPYYVKRAGIVYVADINTDGHCEPDPRPFPQKIIENRDNNEYLQSQRRFSLDSYRLGRMAGCDNIRFHSVFRTCIRVFTQKGQTSMEIRASTASTF